MTISTPTNRFAQAGNNVTVAFTYGARFLANGDLQVIVVTDATGVEDPQVLDTDYTVTGAGVASGGTVTFGTAPAAGTTVVIYGDPAITQGVNPTQNDSLDVDASLEDPLDRLTLIAQRNRDLIDRSLRLPDGDSGFATGAMVLPAKVVRAGTLLGFDADGKPIPAAGGLDPLLPVTPYAATLLDDLTEAEARGTLGVTSTADFADTTDVAKGDALIGGKREDTGAQAFTIHKYNHSRRLLVANDFATGGVGTLADPWTGWLTALNARLAAGKSAEFEAGYFAYAGSIYMLSATPTQLIGAGRTKTILRYDPVTYNVVNTALWVGDFTNDTAVANSAVYPEIHDLTLHCGTNSGIGMRVREGLSGDFSGMFIGALPELPSGVGSPTQPFRGLFVESGVNGVFENFDIDPGNGHQDGTPLTWCLDLRTSTNLDPDGGASGVSFATTMTFNKVYLHHASESAILDGASLGCVFNGLILESCWRGLNIGAGVNPYEFNNLYIENVTSKPIQLPGATSAIGSSVMIDGITYVSPNQGTGLVDGDTLFDGTYFGLVKVKNLRLISAYSQSSLFPPIVAPSNVSVKIEMDAVQMQLNLNPNAGVTTAAGSITTTSGSATFSLGHDAHGLIAGQAVGLQNFTTPYNGLALNQPYYRIQAITDANNYTLKSILFPGTTATGSGTQARNATEKIVVYPEDTWLNCLIPAADRVKLSDCITQELLFSEALTAGAGLTSLRYHNTGGGTIEIRGYHVDDWSYILTAQGFSDAVASGMLAYVVVDMPDGYETNLTLAAMPTAYTGLSYPTPDVRLTAVQTIGMKVPPGTVIRYSAQAPGALNAVMQGRIVIARTGIK